MVWGSRAPIALCVPIVLVAALAGCLAGCASSAPHGVPSAPPTSPPPTATADPSASPSASPAVPILEPHGTATDNLPFFNYVNEHVIATTSSPTGMDFIDALTAAGFDRAEMQVTADKTTVGLTPGSIQFSVRFHGECLIGQNGAGSDGYHSEVAPLLSTGACLIGKTVAIPAG